MRQTCQPLYDHSQLYGVKPVRGIWQCAQERTTLLVLRAVILLLVLMQALRALLPLLELRPPVLRSPRPAHAFWIFTFSPETDIHVSFITPSQYIQIFLFIPTQIISKLDQKINYLRLSPAVCKKRRVWFRLNMLHIRSVLSHKQIRVM